MLLDLKIRRLDMRKHLIEMKCLLFGPKYPSNMTKLDFLPNLILFKRFKFKNKILKKNYKSECVDIFIQDEFFRINIIQVPFETFAI